MRVNPKIKTLDKVEQPIVEWSERYCENIDLRMLIKRLPLIGEQLDDLLAYKGSKIIQDRVNIFFDETKKSLSQLSEEKIDKSFLNGQEGFYLFRKICEQITKAEEKEKVLLFRNIFLNAIKLGNSQYYYKERFIKIVADLSILHIKILKYYFEREQVFKVENRNPSRRFTSLQAVMQKVPELTESQTIAFCNDLARYALLEHAEGTATYSTNSTYRITSSAIEFMNFIIFEEIK